MSNLDAWDIRDGIHRARRAFELDPELTRPGFLGGSHCGGEDE
jgi:hypothetical protein